MEHFEPTHNRPSTSAYSLDYGLIARVVSSETEKNNSKVARPSLVPSSETGSKYNVYSYAYHEPGAVKYHTHFSPVHRPTSDMKIMSSNAEESSRNTHNTSLRAILSRSSRAPLKREQRVSLSPFLENRQTYTTRRGTTENLYEEVNEHKLRNVEISTADYVKEEVRRVQDNHFRVLDELNLSLEALIMPTSPEKLSLSTANCEEDTIENKASEIIPPTQTATTSKMVFTQKPRRYGLLGGDSSSAGQPIGLSNSSLENISVFQSVELKNLPHNLSSNPEFDVGDLDSGFSGSGSSSGASYNESLRNYNSSNLLQFTRNQDFLNSKNTWSSPTAPSVFTSRSSLTTQEDFCSSSVVNGANGFDQQMSPKSFQDSPRDSVHSSEAHQMCIRSIPTGVCSGAKSKKRILTTKS